MKLTLLLICIFGFFIGLHSNQYIGGYHIPTAEYLAEVSYPNSNIVPSKSERDEIIAKEIRKALKGGWFTPGYEQVAVEVFNGNVILRGTVETWNDKTKIERKILKIKGVQTLNTENLHVNEKADSISPTLKETQKIAPKATKPNPTPENQSEVNVDIDTTRKIRQLLMQDDSLSSNAKNIKVITEEGGKVTLRGIVDTEDEKRKIESKVRRIDVITSVDNRLEVNQK